MICIVLVLLLLSGCTLTLGGTEREYEIAAELIGGQDCHMVVTRRETSGDDIKKAELSRSSASAE